MNEMLLVTQKSTSISIFPLSTKMQFFLPNLQALFKSPKCPTPVCTEYANNQLWYVSFGSEEDALAAFQYIREEVKTFKVS